MATKSRYNLYLDEDNDIYLCALREKKWRGLDAVSKIINTVLREYRAMKKGKA